MLIRQMTEEEKQKKKEVGAKVKEIKNKDLCPSCYNQEFGGLYTDYTDRIIYENEKVICFLEEYPRTAAHTIILAKEHYEDISEMPLEVGTAVMEAATHVTNKIKEVLGAVKVYMCTMCDDGRNHLHFQLIPRYEGNVIGSKLFVNERGIVEIDKEIIEKLRGVKHD